MTETTPNNENVSVLFNHVIDVVRNYDFTEKAISIVITLVAFFVIKRIVVLFIHRFFNEERKKLTSQERKKVLTLKKTFSTFARVFLSILEVLTILSFFMDVTALLTVAGVGTLAVSMAAKGFVEDMINGFVIVFEGHFLVGDYVDIEGNYGVVESIGVRTTTVRELDGSLFIIHNRLIDQMINYSKGLVKAGIDVGVAYEENIEYVTEVLNAICDEVYAENNGLFAGKPEVIGVTRMDPSSMNIRIIMDEDAGRKARAEAFLRKRVKEVFDEKGIEIPYNKYVVYPENTIKQPVIKSEEE